MTSLKKMKERYLSPLTPESSVRDVAAEMSVLLEFLVIGGLIVLFTTVDPPASTPGTVILIAGAAAYIATWLWWTSSVQNGKNLILPAVLFSVICLLAWIAANNPMGLMLVWPATAVLYLSFSPLISFTCCFMPVTITSLVHVVGDSSVSKVILETTLSLLLVIVGFYICDSARTSSSATVQKAQAMEKLKVVNDELTEALRQSRDLTLEKERSRIAASLHDNVGHRLATITMGLEYATRMKDKESEKAWAEVEQVRDNVGEALEEMRVVVRALHPIKLEGESLRENLDALAASFTSTRIAVSTRIEDVHLVPPIAAVVIAATQESLTNIVRHSTATQILVTMTSFDGGVKLRIEDNGQGSSAPFGFGLRSLADRAEQQGGEVSVEPHGGLGKGLAVEVRLPRENLDAY